MILKAYHKLLREQKGKEVTVNMVRKSLGLKCSAKTLSRAFWKHGVHFRPLYEKPDLLPADVRARKAWAEEHQHRSGQQWTKYVHAVIDNKTFPIYPTQKFRQYAARRRVRGAYRTKAPRLHGWIHQAVGDFEAEHRRQSRNGHMRHWQWESFVVARDQRKVECRGG